MRSTTTNIFDGLRGDRRMRIVITESGVYWPLVKYFRQMNMSHAAEQRYALSISRLMNWTEAKHPTFRAGSACDSEIFGAFLHDLSRGTVINHDDPFGLWWRPSSSDAVKRTASHIAEFSEWLSATGLGTEINPRGRMASVFEQMIARQVFSHRKNASMMAHAMSDQSNALASLTTRLVKTPKRKKVILQEAPAFPVANVQDLIWDGFRYLDAKPGAPLWATHNLRDMLATMLCLFGGARMSEAMHLWADDVFERPGDPASCRVLIHEPEEGIVDFVNPKSGKPDQCSRMEYLTRHCGGKIPLTLETGRRRSGWKGALLTDPKRKAYEIQWITPDAGRLFRTLWNLYIKHVRAPVSRTPWAFLTKDAQPLGAMAFAESFQSAVQRIGLVSSKAEGTTTHGLRHRYGQWLNDLGVSEKVGQICMHHVSPFSQAVYRQISAQSVSDVMSKATLADPCFSIPAIFKERSCRQHHQ